MQDVYEGLGILLWSDRESLGRPVTISSEKEVPKGQAKGLGLRWALEAS